MNTDAPRKQAFMTKSNDSLIDRLKMVLKRVEQIYPEYPEDFEAKEEAITTLDELIATQHPTPDRDRALSLLRSVYTPLDHNLEIQPGSATHRCIQAFLGGEKASEIPAPVTGCGCGRKACQKCYEQMPLPDAPQQPDDCSEYPAKLVYSAMQWAVRNAENGRFPPDWQEHGNSIAQDIARATVADIVDSMPIRLTPNQTRD